MPQGVDRCRIAPLADASAASLHRFVTDHVEPGATVISDSWQGYSGLDKLDYVHDRRSQRAARSRGEEFESCRSSRGARAEQRAAPRHITES